MILRVHLPEGLAVEEPAVAIVAEAAHGSFCLLPKHVDLTTALVPGILTFRNEQAEEQFLAVDRAILVKRGAEVDIAALRAVRGPDLAELERTVRDEYRHLGDSERRVRTALARLDLGFRRRLHELQEPFPLER